MQQGRSFPFVRVRVHKLLAGSEETRLRGLLTPPKPVCKHLACGSRLHSTVAGASEHNSLPVEVAHLAGARSHGFAVRRRRHSRPHAYSCCHCKRDLLCSAHAKTFAYCGPLAPHLLAAGTMLRREQQERQRNAVGLLNHERPRHRRVQPVQSGAPRPRRW